MSSQTHDITLADGSLRLRPMTPEDLVLVLRWNKDPAVSGYADSEPVDWTPALVEQVYVALSQKALLFIAEVSPLAIGGGVAAGDEPAAGPGAIPGPRRAPHRPARR